VTTLNAKPHIKTRADGRVVVEYRVPSLKAVSQFGLVQVSSFQNNWSNWTTIIDEPFTGAWQRNIRQASQHNLLGFGAVYACISLIAGDIKKLRIALKQWVSADKIWAEILPQEVHGNDSSASIIKLLNKPNTYQTRIQFIESWLISKLLYGNVYVAKERDRPGGDVIAEHVLDPCLVTPLVSPDGDVFYALKRDYLAGVGDENVIVPASEMIHDRMNCFWHPLIGVPPLYAAALSGSHGLAIQGNAQKFFENQSRPSGIILAPGQINKDKAAEIKDRWQSGFSGDNIGKTAVLGDGMKYEVIAIAAEQSQLAEQWGLTIEDVARAFLVPPYKIGIEKGLSVANVSQLDQDYYSQCLQPYIEAIESCQDDGLSLPADQETEFDLEGLFRMDPLGRAETNLKRVQAGELAPDEARRTSNLPPVPGGKYPYLQQQNYSLAALEKRDSSADPFAKTPAQPTQPQLPLPPVVAPPSAKDVAAEVSAMLPPQPTAAEVAKELAAMLAKAEESAKEAVIEQFGAAILKFRPKRTA
jgi:HK97 family phage portal protein